MSFLKSLLLWVVSLVSAAVALLIAIYGIAHRDDSDIWMYWGMVACVLVFTVAANPLLSRMIPPKNKRGIARLVIACAAVVVGIGLIWKAWEPAAQERQAIEAATNMEEERCMHGSVTDCGAAELGADRLHDAKRAWALANRSCDLKERFGCLSVAERLYAGKGVAVNLPLARKTFAAVCDPAQKLDYCIGDYITMLRHGEGGPADEQTAQKICSAVSEAPCECLPTSKEIEKCKDDRNTLGELE